jgi:hypothetical protein
MATQWKYAVVFLEADDRDGTRRPKNRPDLDNIGVGGWEAFSVVPVPAGYQVFFKQPQPEPVLWQRVVNVAFPVRR